MQTAKVPEPKAVPHSVAEPLSETKTPAVPLDPLVEKWNALFDKFKSADYEKRIELFLGSMDEPGLLDGEGAFDMLDNIYQDTVRQREYARFNELVDTLRQRLPEVYADSEAYYLDWYICNALALNQPEVLAARVRELARIAHEIDVFYWTVDLLSYYGYLPLLVEAMRIARPEVETSGDIMEFAIDEFADNAVKFEILNYFEHNPEPNPDDPDLRSRLEYFIKNIRMDKVTEVIKCLSGQTGRQWSPGDFGNLKSETSRLNLKCLSQEFLGELYRESRINLTRGEMGRLELVKYLLERADGDLEPRPSMFEAMTGSKKPHKPVTKPPRPPHVLCPDRERLDRFLADVLNFMNPQIYKAAACFEIIPDWLRFLESRGLIDGELRNRILNDLRPLQEHMETIVTKHFPDPAQRPVIKEF